MLIHFSFGCSKSVGNLKEIDIKVDDNVIFKVYDSDKISVSKQDGKIYVHTEKIPLEMLKNYEEKSYSKKILSIAKNNRGNLYETIESYLNSYDFLGNDYALYNNRFDSIDDSGVNKKRFPNKPIINNGQVKGEYVYKDNSFHCFSYVFMYFSNSYFYTTEIELYRIDSSILENEKEYFEKENNDFLSYYWISDEKRLEFYRILESDACNKLPLEFQLLRKSKDLFLNSLTINDV